MSAHTPVDWAARLRLLLLIAVLPLLALLLTLMGFVVLEAVGVIDSATSSDNVDELFARLYVVCLLACVSLPLVVQPGLRRWMVEQRWVWILAVLFALGVISALADPFSAVRAETNLIRYWTAGILLVAATVAFVSAVGPSRSLVERSVGIGFALALVLGAADELLELHENAGDQFDSLAPALGDTSGQDLLLLGLAGAGVAAAVAVVVLLRFVPSVRDVFAQRTYQRAFAFFALAVLSFAAAMMLDSFDWVLQSIVDRVQELVGATPDTVAVAWLAGEPISQAANSVEELLEFLAALFFLTMVGAFFSVRALGWDEASGGEAIEEV